MGDNYFYVVISNSNTNTMIRLHCKRDITFEDLWLEIEEDMELPFAFASFLFRVRGRLKIFVLAIKVMVACRIRILFTLNGH